MPTYRYRCSDCGEEFELWQSIKDDAIRTHDDGCGGRDPPAAKVARQVPSPGSAGVIPGTIGAGR